MLTDPDKQATGNREPADETNEQDPMQGIPDWLQPFTVNLAGTATRDLSVGDIFQDRRQASHQEAVHADTPTVRPTQAKASIPSGDLR